MQEKGFNFDDTRLMRGAWRNEPNPDMCKVNNFARLLLFWQSYMLSIQAWVSTDSKFDPVESKRSLSYILLLNILL